MKKILYAIVLLVVAGACSPVKVTYDKSAPFRQYRRFAYVKSRHETHLPVKYQRIIVYEIDRFIKALPLEPDRSRPDILVKIDMDFHRRVDVYHEPFIGIHHSMRKKSYEGTVRIIFTDARTGKKVWEAVFGLNFSRESELRRMLKKYLLKALEKYPA